MKSAELLKPPLECIDIIVLIKLSVDEKRQWVGRSREEDEAIFVEVEEENRTVSIPFWLSLLFLPCVNGAVLGQSLSSINYYSFLETSKFIKQDLSDYVREIAEDSFSLVMKPKAIVIDEFGPPMTS
uniref:Uncharacterized protein n=1 Tax=Nelumbo nucifera TaxID=4432 RepID=A0A822ZUY6_NELNU|nr:TPA_asm: hypothetical protein HUJ06_017046 [Nelumbo nucifera]